MIEITRKVRYTLTSSFSRMTVHVSVYEDGSGWVSGWIRRDFRRLDQIDAYVAKHLRHLWERGDRSQFTYAFGPGALSDQVALDLNAIMDTESAPEREKRLKKEAAKHTRAARNNTRAHGTGQ